MNDAKCPGCSKPFHRPTSALSRFDNKTDICALCGHAEGIAQYAAAQAGLDPRSVLRAPGRLTPTGARLLKNVSERGG
jgi:hypothetical protein